MYKKIALLILVLLLALPTVAQDTMPELTLPAPTPTPSFSPSPQTAPAQTDWVTASLIGLLGVALLGVITAHILQGRALGQSVPYQIALGYAYNRAKQTPQTWDEAILDEVADLTDVTIYQDEKGVWRVVTNEPATTPVTETTEENK